jgi:hypothetical protein
MLSEVQEWGNTEIKVCTFAATSDEDASMVEIQEKIQPPDAEVEPTTSELPAN